MAWAVHAAVERLAGREPPLIPVPRASAEVELRGGLADVDGSDKGSVDIPSLYRELRMLGGEFDDLD